MAGFYDEPKVYSWDEVKKHNFITDLWVVIEGKVYDVSEFVEEHPGGDGPLMEQAGKDATDAFIDVGHSEGALEQLGDYVIGVVDQSSQPANNTPPDNKVATPLSAAVSAEITETVNKENPEQQENSKKSSTIHTSSDSKKPEQQSVAPPQTTSSFYKSLLIPIALILFGIFVKFYWTE